MMKLLKVLTLAAVAASFVGCSSAVKRPGQTASAPVERHKVSDVSVVLSDSVQERLKANDTFDSRTLLNTVRQSLQSKGMIDPASRYTMEVYVTNVRVRSSFNAVMFGFMAGADSLAGNIRVKDANQREVDNYDVTASYALGGFAGGQNSARMGWLYEEFAKLTTEEMVGEAMASEEMVGEAAP